jgi:hypothetical protein
MPHIWYFTQPLYACEHVTRDVIAAVARRSDERGKRRMACNLGERLEIKHWLTFPARYENKRYQPLLLQSLIGDESLGVVQQDRVSRDQSEFHKTICKFSNQKSLKNGGFAEHKKKKKKKKKKKNPKKKKKSKKKEKKKKKKKEEGVKWNRFEQWCIEM